MRAEWYLFKLKGLFRLNSVFGLALACLVVREVSAQTTNSWTNTMSGNWTVASNWTPGAPSSSSTTILQFMANGGTLAVSANSRLGSTLNAISIATNATLQINGSFNNARTITLGTRGGRVEVTGSNVLTQSGLLTGNNGFTKNGTGVMVVQTTS